MKYMSCIVGAVLFSTTAIAEDASEFIEPPSYKLFRADEDYSYLASDGAHLYEKGWSDSIKYISLTDDGSIYSTIGGEFRPRFEYFKNRQWEANADEDFYSQRVSAYAGLYFGQSVRVFAEFYHGYNGGEKEFAQFDELDWHQGFVEVRPEIPGNGKLMFRLGRQEVAFGAARLVGIREGPNIRRTFDAVRADYSIDETMLKVFYGREVRPEFHGFDNDFVLFDDDAPNPELWSLHTKFSIPGDVGPTEVYYLGFRADSARFNDVAGKEIRHTIGVRRFGSIGKRWHYNTELMYQFGDIDGNAIRAYNIEADWNYELINTPWRPTIGLKLEFTSGDNRPGDGEVNSFNPMFVNPAYYSLATVITPVNLRSIHPSLRLHPSERFSLYFEWASFWRESSNDGLYSPPRFLERDSAGVSSSKIGNQVGIKVTYEMGRHLSFELDFSYFMVDDFLEVTGTANNLLHIAPSISFKF